MSARAAGLCHLHSTATSCASREGSVAGCSPPVSPRAVPTEPAQRCHPAGMGHSGSPPPAVTFPRWQLSALPNRLPCHQDEAVTITDNALKCPLAAVISVINLIKIIRSGEQRKEPEKKRPGHSMMRTSALQLQGSRLRHSGGPGGAPVTPIGFLELLASTPMQPEGSNLHQVPKWHLSALSEAGVYQSSWGWACLAPSGTAQPTEPKPGNYSLRGHQMGCGSLVTNKISLIYADTKGVLEAPTLPLPTPAPAGFILSGPPLHPLPGLCTQSFPPDQSTAPHPSLQPSRPRQS